MIPKLILVIALAGLCFSILGADDTVAIPKSRLEELERKEAELQRLKATPAPAPAAVQTAPAASSAAPAPAPQPARVSPPMASLPAVAAGDLVEAADLANHYSADAAAADARYRKVPLKVRGEVTRIDKRMFQRTYELTVKTPEQGPGVILEVTPPDSYDAIYTANHGTELVAKAGPSTLQVLKLGQTVVVDGRCKGMKGRMITVSGKLR